MQSENIQDISEIENINEESLFQKLKNSQGSYARVGSSGLVQIRNPHPSEFVEEIATHYIEKGYKDVDGEDLPQPHLYDLVARSYFHMRRIGQDQVIVLSGPTRSGKTASYKRFVEQLIQLSSHKKDSPVNDQIRKIPILLEAFGHAPMNHNEESTRYGLFQELQFNERGRLIGTKLLPYMFDKYRISTNSAHDGIFNIFYHLLNGTTSEEKTNYGLDFANHFKYIEKNFEFDDKQQLSLVKETLKSFGIKNKTISHLFRTISSIFYLGNTEFKDDKYESEQTLIKTPEALDIVSQLLGVTTGALEATLINKTKVVRNELCTVILDAEMAADQRDDFANFLYSLIFSWVIELINYQLCKEDSTNIISLFDQFGQHQEKVNSFDTFFINFVNDRITDYVFKNVFYDEQGINREIYDDGIRLPDFNILIPSIDLLCGKSAGSSSLIQTLDEFSKKHTEKESKTKLFNLLQTKHSGHAAYAKSSSKSLEFGITHFDQTVHYSLDNFSSKNNDTFPPDFINLFKEHSRNSFVLNLLNSVSVETESHPKDKETITEAHHSSKPVRRPSRKRSVRRKHQSVEVEEGDQPQNVVHQTVLSQLNSSMTDIFSALEESKLWFMIHFASPSGGRASDQALKSQIKQYKLIDMAKRLQNEPVISFTYNEFINRYNSLLDSHQLNDRRSVRQKIESMAMIYQWPDASIQYGRTKAFFTWESFRQLESNLKNLEKKKRIEAKYGSEADFSESRAIPNLDETESVFSGFNGGERLPPSNRFSNIPENAQEMSFYNENTIDHQEPTLNVTTQDRDNNGDSPDDSDVDEKEKFALEKEEALRETVEEVEITSSRRWWTRITWFLTWWIPSKALNAAGMKRPDIQMAWREKFAIFLLIVLVWAIQLFFIIGLTYILCPPQKVYTTDEVGFHLGETDLWAHMRGTVYDISSFLLQNHDPQDNDTPDRLLEFGGSDMSFSFPLPINEACPQLVSDEIFLKRNETEVNARFVHDSGPLSQRRETKLGDPQWYWKRALPRLKRLKVGDVVWNVETVDHMRKEIRQRWSIINKRVYNLEAYFDTIQFVTDDQPAGVADPRFLDRRVEQLFDAFDLPVDLTERWNTVIPANIRKDQLDCLDQLFFLGTLDERQSFRCLFPNYFLLAITCAIVAVIGIKFIAALQLSPKRKPEDHDKFVICQVPCYTEDESSLRRTIDSLAGTMYDDKHKLIFLICDGMIIGRGNDRPTPRIVLDIFGVDPKFDPEPKSFVSIAEGSKQHNMAKVYSGLYEYEGHVVPYVLVAKCGKPSERSRPGNRGKRDSQMLLMRFLNRVHFDKEMSPLDLEIYHQMKNVIGVHPSLCEFILMVDADTEVSEDALNRLVSNMVNDVSIIGICGETKLSNEDKTFMTMIQVYEYYISHHLTKAFESLFGSVTCLPGCFCMYRVRTSKGSPIIVADNVVNEYGENHVDTLHKKNLLSLGEDRYLTTLMMKHFSQYKMKFTPDAYCQTTAPDKWSVLLSQRRRWINSTIHNMIELLNLPDLCGFCCFSMRFVVFLDLFGTVTLPVTVIYIGYILYLLFGEQSDVALVSLIMFGAVYGLQAIIFILKRQWQHVGWMIFYLLGLPFFAFFIPIYAFWHMNDFSWGNTRIVVGEGKRQIFVTDEGQFDPSEIPMKKWSDYEKEMMWDAQSNHSYESMGSRQSYAHQYENQSSYGDLVPRPSSQASYLLPPRPSSAYSSHADLRNSQYDMSASRQSIGYNDHPSQYMTPADESYMRPPSSASFHDQNIPLLPSDDTILQEIRNVIATADLMTITKKQVRDHLSQVFGCDLTPKKDFINQSIEMILQGKL